MHSRIFAGYLLLLLCLFTGRVAAQIEELSTQTLVELSAEKDQSIDEDLEELEWRMRLRTRIDINTIGEEELISWGLLTPNQVVQFLSYRAVLGKFIHVNELQAVPGWFPALIKLLLPYVSVKPGNEPYKKQQKAILQLSMRSAGLRLVHPSIDSSSNNWLGDLHRLVLQARMEYRGWRMGVTAKKDPGEPLWKKGVQRGFDFYGVHAHWQGKGLIKTITLGDYTVNMGQGLIHWQALALRKSGELSLIKRQAPVFKPHRSGGEFNFHRGVAVQLRLKRWELSAFISRRRLTAGLISDTAGNPIFARSINSSGYHRSPSEIASKSNLSEWIQGVRLSKQKGSFKWGFNAINYQYGLPFAPGNEPYQRYKFSGQNWRNTSLDFSYSYNNAHFFGELALDKKFNKAFVGGVIVSADPRFDFSLVLRVLSKEFQSFYSNALTESTVPSNEIGLLMAIAIRPSHYFQLNLYNDFYQFPWLRYRLSMPSGGRDHFIQATYQPTKSTVLLVRWRQEQKPEDPVASTALTPFSCLLEPVKSSIRIHAERKIDRRLSFRFRAEALWLKNKTFNVGADPSAETGFMSYWETGYSLDKFRMKLAFRAQYYDTESYRSRIYSFLSDPSSSFSITANYGRGVLGAFFVSKKLIYNWLMQVSLLLKKDTEQGKINPVFSARLSWNPY